LSVAGQTTPAGRPEAPAPLRAPYLLGQDDQISVRILEAPELAEKPLRIDASGFIGLPLAGRVHAGGRTVEQLETELRQRLQPFIREPHVSVSIEEFRSQPVSVIGAVTNPGVVQLSGHKTLAEVLSMVGGLKPDAGYIVKVTRRLEEGRIPINGAQDDPNGQFSVAEINLPSIIDARNPEDNIAILPNDVISVPRGRMIYVVGEVEKSGGFVLNERGSMSVLQAVSLAGGLHTTASAQNARILRGPGGAAGRTEIAVDVKKILAGKARDQELQPDDILFIPTSKVQKAGIRALEAAIQLGTAALWRF
jgi:polysaccharide export outer membrane protein